MSAPQLPPGVRRAFRLARRRPAIDEDVGAEIAFHLEMRAAELVRRGWTPEAARAEAARRFGDTHHWSEAMSDVDRERAAEQRRTEWLGDLGQDVRYGARALRRAPLFTLLAVITLALGIGANAAVFGVLKSVLLDALPYADAGRLVRVHARQLDGTLQRMPMSAGTAFDVAERQRSFERVAAFEGRAREGVLAADAGGEPRAVMIEWAEPALFRTLGVSTAAGRPLADDDAEADTVRAVVVTHAAWQRFLGGDPGVVGREVRINGIPRTVVGVLPRGFVGPVADADVYFPLNLRPYLRNPFDGRVRHNHSLVGRLRPGVTADAAQRELAAIFAQLAREHPKENGNEGVAVVPMREDMVGDTRTPLLVLMASAGLVLLITCANLAGALLSRTLSRRKELAVRASLGAGRGRLARQLLTESTLLALAGGALGVGLAALALAALRRLAPPGLLPPYAELSLDGGAVLFTSALAVATGLGFGVAPALSASRGDVQGTLRDEARASSEGARSRRLRGLLVAGQLALCVSLLAGAGLLVRSLRAMTALPLGYDPDGVLVVAVQLPRAGYATPVARVQFMDRLAERLRALPGVAAVASVGQAPSRVTNRNGFVVPGMVAPPADAQSIMLFTEVSDDYFRTLGIPLVEGRTFGPGDGGEGPPAIVISRRAARAYWPRGGAVGARVRMGREDDAPEMVIVGVVGDVRNDPAQAQPEPIQYMTYRANPWNGPVFLVRARAGDPLALAPAARRAVATVDPGVPVQEVTTLRALLADRLSGRRLPVVLMSAFGALALLLASVGVYALFAAMAAARQREFGVRVALGSTPGAIAALVLRQGGVWLALGLAGGAAGVAAVARLVRGLLYGVGPFDPVTLGTAVAVLLACAAVALLVPVRRATRADPITALRQ